MSYGNQVNRLRQIASRSGGRGGGVDNGFVGPSRSQDPLNADQSVRQRRREGHEETIRHASHEKARTDAYARSDKAARDTAIHRVDVQEVFTDFQTELRARALMQRESLDEYIGLVDTIKTIACYADNGIAELDQIRDEEVKKSSKNSIRHTSARLIALARLAVFGCLNDPDGPSRSEELL
ncbi:hypothetical protein Mal64_35640 [Pseudobythopirellula maris]|uniref:Uncharacterized protein n=1 Tax=Pseudobythopirellula maris TaxID=2527991 RepID=A0A5C5ZHY8_9BACT|nr:hypothetical protein [Pseudobythopirellula maris]TWT86735.1 hypothetical protein Mal64_35640 [Pseudobythopirellula maris]